MVFPQWQICFFTHSHRHIHTCAGRHTLWKKPGQLSRDQPLTASACFINGANWLWRLHNSYCAHGSVCLNTHTHTHCTEKQILREMEIQTEMPPSWTHTHTHRKQSSDKLRYIFRVLVFAVLFSVFWYLNWHICKRVAAIVKACTFLYTLCAELSLL